MSKKELTLDTENIQKNIKQTNIDLGKKLIENGKYK